MQLMNYMIGVISMAINFPKFEIPKLELGSIIPNIPKIPDLSNMKFAYAPPVSMVTDPLILAVEEVSKKFT